MRYTRIQLLFGRYRFCVLKIDHKRRFNVGLVVWLLILIGGPDDSYNRRDSREEGIYVDAQ